MKLNSIYKRISTISIIIGVLLLLIGFYYEAGKAGIPYQDPTPELMEKYKNYSDIGHTFYKVGLSIISIGCLLLIIQRVTKSKN
jgi:uncharacterized membrane protein